MQRFSHRRKVSATLSLWLKCDKNQRIKNTGYFGLLETIVIHRQKLNIPEVVEINREDINQNNLVLNDQTDIRHSPLRLKILNFKLR